MATVTDVAAMHKQMHDTAEEQETHNKNGVCGNMRSVFEEQ